MFDENIRFHKRGIPWRISFGFFCVQMCIATLEGSVCICEKYKIHTNLWGGSDSGGKCVALVGLPFLKTLKIQLELFMLHAYAGVVAGTRNFDF